MRLLPRSTAQRLATVLVTAGAIVVLLGGCRAAALAYGPDIASAKVNANALAAAIEARFTNVARSPRFSAARMRIARYAFAPSKLEHDTSLWTAMRTTRTGADRDQ